MTHGIESRAAARLVVWGVALAALLGVGTPAVAEAQSDREIRRAEKLEAQAEKLHDQRHRWDRAAWAYRQAASLRPAGDVQAVRNLERAAKLSYYTGDLNRSMQDYRTAVSRAMEGGDVLTAAHLLVDGAWVAERAGRTADARELLGRARLLASAPVLSPDLQASILDRIREGNVAATTAFGGQIHR